MINLLIDVSIKTMIGMLPEIINSNNEAIKNEFSDIIDSSGNMRKNVYLPEGVVNAATGLFRNADIDTLNLYNVESCNNIVSNVDHNKLKLRHYKVDGDKIEEISASNINLYAHNTGSIVHYKNNIVENLYDVIEELRTKVNGRSTYTVMPTVYGSVLNNIEVLENPNSYTLDDSVLFSNKTLLMKLKLHPWQYLDIANGILYTYYDYNNIVTINDEYPASILGIEGSIISVKFDDKKKKGFYKILLSRKDNKHLRVSKDELVRLKLICIGNDDTYGTEWDVESYSVRNPEDISIVKK